MSRSLTCYSRQVLVKHTLTALPLVGLNNIRELNGRWDNNAVLFPWTDPLILPGKALAYATSRRLSMIQREVLIRVIMQSEMSSLGVTYPTVDVV